ncbi:hypothetical protein [Bradyrhizobium sp.]|uniref:hypothetical protein n=1 Tax=Bradyrhizobium sp. TaxID=376 RepID=UPI001D438E78|nr:hypothetical protein [Bradyrhizobium sp.]MBI5318444.1 hypothetical protein [Bradyrhizobium sp.]
MVAFRNAKSFLALAALMSLVVTAPARSQAILGGKIKIESPIDEEPPVAPGVFPCATDAEKEELARLRDSWQSTYDAMQQGQRDIAAAKQAEAAAFDAKYNADFALGQARNEMMRARDALQEARKRGAGAAIGVVYLPQFEAALKKHTDARAAAQKAEQAYIQAAGRRASREAAVESVKKYVIEARQKYEAAADKLRESKRCPPSQSSLPLMRNNFADRWSGFNGGAFVNVSNSRLNITERFAATGLQTNAFSDSATRAGGGVTIGYNTIIGGHFVAGMAVNLGVAGGEVRHPFPPTPFFLGTTQTFTVDLLGRAGVLVAPNFLLYSQAGVSVASNRIQIDFGGTPTDVSKTSVAAAVGGGVEVKLPMLASGGSAMGDPSIFFDYLHRFPSSVGTERAPFTYDFERRGDQAAVGFRFRFNPSATGPI